MAKVLFVDDEADILGHYQNALAKSTAASNQLALVASEIFNSGLPVSADDEDLSDVACFSANQGLKALEIIANELKSNDPIQVVFLDMRMPPGIDGKETAIRMRNMDPNIEIVIVTAYSDTRPDQLLKEIGKADKILFIKKPFENSEIRQLVRNLIAKYKSERVKENFIDNVTHELKTPLASILGFTELLLAEIPQTDPMAEYIRITRSNAQLMKSLISDLIETIYVSKRGIQICKEKVDLGVLLQETYQSLKGVHENENVSLNFRKPASDIYLELDSNKLRQALYNIIGNALKFTDKGSVEIELSENDEFVKLTIKDTGVGIPEECLKSICEKFFRVESDHHSKPGFGLGLYIVKNILDAHEIKFSIRSKVNEGTCFDLYFNKRKLA